MGIDSYLGIGKPEEKKEICVESPLGSIIFEPRAAYCGDNKKLYTFGASLWVLRKRGYDRHPRPAEAFDLVCRGLEGRLQSEQQAIVDDMSNSYGEWLSLAIKKEKDKLHLYFDPENVEWTRTGHYIAQGDLKYASKKVYNIQSLDDQVPIKDVNKVNPELVEMLWSHPYTILPEEFRKHATIFFPPGDGIWPVHHNHYSINCYYNKFGASRGIRLR